MNHNNDEIRNYADFLNCLSPNELGVIAALAGLYLAQGLTGEQQNAIGNFLEAIGQLIQCIGSQKQNLDSRINKK